MIETVILGIPLKFETSPELFSPGDIDKGTLAMLNMASFNEPDKVLDLGCGYGVVGITVAKIIGAKNVIMSDISEPAIYMSKKNAKLNGVDDVKIVLSDGFNNLIDTDFTIILSNPPYHTDFSIAKHFIEKGFNRLQIGGKLYMVTKRKDWYKNKISSIFGGVKMDEVDGYYVFQAEKRSLKYANRYKFLAPGNRK